MPASYLLIGGLTVLPALFWFWFYFFYLAKSEKQLKRTALLLLGVGMATSGGAYIIERGVFNFLPPEAFVASIADLRQLFWLAVVSFLIVAPVEEGVKYLGVRLFAFPSLKIDKVADMIRAGVAVGLGFATVENALYFFTAAAQGTGELSEVFILRFAVSTLAHTLYSAVMAYFLGLAKFHAVYRGHFLRMAVFVPVLIHGTFNFFIILGFNIVSLAALAAAFVALLGWFSTRVNFQKFLPAAEARKVLTPLFANRAEFEAFVSHEKVTFDIIKKLEFCPFCLAKKEFADQEVCRNCNRRFRPQKGPSEILKRKAEVTTTDVGE